MYCVHGWLWQYNYPFILEPGKKYSHVDDYLYENHFKLRVIRKKLDVGLKKAERAWDFYQRGKNDAAKRIWRSMFGRQFPLPQAPKISKTVQPVPSPAPTLQDLLHNQSAMGLMGGTSRKSLFDFLADPPPKPQPGNALLSGLLNPNNPFKK